MFGETLFPLNQLKDSNPSLYKEHVKKYEGREKLLLRKVPLLDCLWNDVIHLSPINPQIILDIFKEKELVPEIRRGEVFETYKIPIQNLNEDQIVCFQSFNFDPNNFDPSLNKFWKFDRNSYEELKSVPKEQVDVWLSDKAAGRVLFWYSHTMHILYRGSIDISACEIINCS